MYLLKSIHTFIPEGSLTDPESKGEETQEKWIPNLRWGKGEPNSSVMDQGLALGSQDQTSPTKGPSVVP